MFTTHAAIASLLAEESTTPVHLEFPGAYVAIELAFHAQEAEEEDTEDQVTLTKRKLRILSNNERQHVLHLLLKFQGRDGKLMRGAFGKVSKEIKVKPRTCSRIWKRYVDTRSPTIPAGDIRNRRSNCRRKNKSLIELERIRAIPYEQRVTSELLQN